MGVEITNEPCTCDGAVAKASATRHGSAIARKRSALAGPTCRARAAASAEQPNRSARFWLRRVVRSRGKRRAGND